MAKIDDRVINKVNCEVRIIDQEWGLIANNKAQVFSQEWGQNIKVLKQWRLKIDGNFSSATKRLTTSLMQDYNNWLNSFAIRRKLIRICWTFDNVPFLLKY